MPWDRVHDEAEVLEHVLSEELEELIAAKLGHPTADPHGDPIPTPTSSIAERAGRRRSRTLEPGAAGRFVRVSDADPAMLRWLAERYVRPGDDARGARQAALRRPADGPGRRRGARARAVASPPRCASTAPEALGIRRGSSSREHDAGRPAVDRPPACDTARWRSRGEHGEVRGRATGSARATYAEVGKRAARLANALRGSGSTATSASPPFSGTTRSTSRPTSPSRRWAPCCTRSTSACSPSRSSTSPTTPRTRSSSSTRRWSSRWPRSCRTFETVEHVLVTGEDPDLVAARGQGRRGALLRGAARRRIRRVRLGRGRRERRRGHVLHERHDRQPEGRRLQPPLDGPALDGRLHGRRDGPEPDVQGPRDRPAVPRDGLGPAVRGDARRRVADHARALPAARAAAEDDRGGQAELRRRRPDDLAGHAAAARGRAGDDLAA